MKKSLFLFLMPLFIGNKTSPPYQPTKIDPNPIKVKTVKLEPKPIHKLVNALIYVESKGNDSAIGDRHLKVPSVGVLQIRPVMVREANRILRIQGSNKQFTLKDRFNREKSIEIFMTWKNYHHPNSNFETIARNWNGGPKGYKSSKTVNYWNKVKNKLNG